MDPPQIIEQYSQFNFHYFPEGTHFCLRKELGDAVARSTGRLFWAPAPDFSASLLALAEMVEGRYCYIDSVLGFGGRSMQSNAAGLVKSADPEASGSRLKQFLAESDDDDSIFPHHSLKVPFYYNLHFAAISVLKRHYPDYSGLEMIC
jgi:hypothetical protein